ncbi:MAG: hypothetical protein V4792_08020 [Pseudomonadota bacterium]
MRTAPLLVCVVVLWFALSMTARSEQEQEFYYTVTKHSTFDFKGIQFFQLKSVDGSATISVDGDVRLAEALKALDGQRIRITLENATLVLKRVER